MNVGELVVNIGIKGAEKTVGALGGVRKGLGEISSMSLEAKAGLLGAFYGLERLTAASGQAGTDLQNFNALTGISIQTLQRYQFAARQVGISNEEMANTFGRVQSAMAENILHGTNSGNLAFIGSRVGFDQSRRRDTEYVLGQFQKFAQAVPPELAKNVLSPFVSDHVIAGFRRNAFRPDVLARAPTYSDSQSKALDRANIAWANLANKIEMAVGKMNAAYGGQLVNDISKLVPQVLALTASFLRLNEALHGFEALAKAFEGWSKIFGGSSTAVSTFAGAIGDKEKMVKLGGTYNEFISHIPAAIGLMLRDMVGSPYGQGKIVNVDITNHFQHDGKDHQKTGDSMHKAVKKALRQMPAQGQGS